MVEIPYSVMVLAISIAWMAVRATVCIRQRKVELRREALLLLVYICIIVVVRFTFCPFRKVAGEIQPLLFDPAQVWPFRVNLVPAVHLMDYPRRSEALLNLIGNTAMFLPLGIVWPGVFPKLDRHWKVLAAGAGFSLCIELMQLPFFDRVSDIDDLLLNTLGFAAGYGIWLLCRFIGRRKTSK